MAEHHQTGKSGEERAAAYLSQKGYEILGRNERFGKAEIDIVARIGNEIVFVEVKTRTGNYFGFPEEAIDQQKIALMGKAAEQYAEENPEAQEIRFDLISLVLGSGTEEIVHIEDAFFPGTAQF